MAKKLLDTIKFLLRLISCVSICLLVVIVFMQVINRNFFDHSFTWVEEVASMAMVFITYLGAAGYHQQRQYSHRFLYPQAPDPGV